MIKKCERLREKLKKNEIVRGTCFTIISDPIIIQKMDHPNLDFVVLDMEHGRYDAQNIVPILNTCRTIGLPTIVRVQDALYHLVAKPLDMGADGIMLPRTETLEQLKTAVDGLCFFPIGRKGNGGIAQLLPGETIEEFNQSRFLMPQIESPKGIENLPSMIETYSEHISAIIIGPYDMSVMVGTPCNIYSEIMIKSIKKVFDICHSYQMSCGIFCNNYSDAIRFRNMGANVLWTGTDGQFLSMGLHNTLSDLMKIN